MKNKLKLVPLFLFFWMVFQAAYIGGTYYQQQRNDERFIASIEIRIALDLPKLKIANEKFKTAADPLAIKTYIEKFNQVLEGLNSPVSIVGLQNITVDNVAENPQRFSRTLQTSDQMIDLELMSKPMEPAKLFNLFAPIFALCMSALTYYRRPKSPTKTAKIESEPSPKEHSKLIINLKNKSIAFGQTKPVALSNKPFCFYAALVDYCLHTELPNLKHNTDVPDELLQIANKYFYRLIELGHTKRKRPDFSANLDKTLSEIRSALDEVFKNNPEIKEHFYPPKAQGEGSRSKMHNYAISNKSSELVEFIGK